MAVSGGIGVITLQTDMTKSVNYALAAAGLAVVRSAAVGRLAGAERTAAGKEKTEAGREMLSVHVISGSGFVQEWRGRVPFPEPGETVTLPFPGNGLGINPEQLAALAELDEPRKDHIRVEVFSCVNSGDSSDNAGEGRGTPLVAEEYPVTLYPFHSWTGSGEYPELLAAYITPGRPPLAGIISRAGELLRTWTGDGTLDGYHSHDQQRVLRQISALYIAVRDHGMQYVHSPENLGDVPVQVRFAEESLEGHVAGCVDLTLLFCSLLEAVHLHPVILQSRGHFFCGLWLDETSYMPAVTEGTERAAGELNRSIGVLAVFEPTLVTRADTNFETARRTGEMETRDSVRPVERIYDIEGIRQEGIRPLPLRTATDEEMDEFYDQLIGQSRKTGEPAGEEEPDGGKQPESQGNSGRSCTEKPTESGESGAETDGTAEQAGVAAREDVSEQADTSDGPEQNDTTITGRADAEAQADTAMRAENAAGSVQQESSAEAAMNPGRAAKWLRQLLDLSPANPLLDLQAGEILPLLSPSPDGLLSAMGTGENFAIYPQPESWDHETQDKNEAEADRRREAAGLAGVRAASPEFMSDPGSGRSQVIAELTMRRLRSPLREDRLAEVQKNIRSRGMDLYLVLGMLCWRDPDLNGAAHYAPVLIVPAELVEDGESGSAMRLSGSEPILNGALFTMLHNTFGMDLPEETFQSMPGETGKVQAVLQRLRDAVLNMKQWQVLSGVCIAPLPAASYFYWRDLTEHLQDLERNAAVRALAFGDGKEEQEQADFDRRADSVPRERVLQTYRLTGAEQRAVRAGAADSDFVLIEDKPGSGCRTAAALITGALADRRRVLLSSPDSETMRRVEDLLGRLGLTGFVYHPVPGQPVGERKAAASYKNIPDRYMGSAAYRRKTDQAAQLEQSLQAYEDALMQTRSCGLSVWQMVTSPEMAGVSDRKDLPAADGTGGTDRRILFEDSFLRGLTAGEMDRCNNLVDQLTEAAEKTGGVAVSPLRAVTAFHQEKADAEEAEGLESGTPEAGTDSEDSGLFSGNSEDEPEENPDRKEQIRAAAADFAAALAPVRKAAENLYEKIGQEAPRTREDYEAADALAKELAFWGGMPVKLARADPIEAAVTGIRELCERIRRRDAGRQNLAGDGAEGRGFSDGFFDLDGDALRLKWEESAEKFVLTRNSEQSRILRILQQYSDTRISRESVESILTGLVQYRQDCKEADRLLAQYRDCLGGLYKGDDTDWNQIGRLAGKALASAQRMDDAYGKALRLQSAAVPEVTAAAAAYDEAWTAEQSAETALRALVPFENGTEDFAAESLKLAEALQKEPDALDHWMEWNRIRNEAGEMGLGPVVQALENGREPEEVRGAYRRGIMTSLIREAVSESPALQNFSKNQYEEQIRQLGKISGEIVNLSKVELFGRLSGRSSSSPEERPVVVASPSTAAQCLTGARGYFDLVIVMDGEDIPAREAAGLLARGREAVIVGCPYKRTLAESSLLDDARSVGIPEVRLGWGAAAVKDADGMADAGTITAAASADNSVIRGVADTLQKDGYICRESVPEPPFTIDIAAMPVKGEDDAGKSYLMPEKFAILLDGTGWGIGLTAADREVYRTRILERRGWKVRRAWTMDWWRNPEAASAGILRTSSAAESGETDREMIAAAAGTAGNVSENSCEISGNGDGMTEDSGDAAGVPEDYIGNGGASEVHSGTDGLAAGPDAADSAAVPPEHGNAECMHAEDVDAEGGEYASEEVNPDYAADESEGENAGREEDLPENRNLDGMPYHAARLPVHKLTVSSFVKPENENMICNNLRIILQEEAPISEELLMRRVLASFGITRVVSKTKNRVVALLTDMQIRTTLEDGKVFYWNSGRFYGFRVSGSGENRRDAADVPECELEAAVTHALAAGQPLDEETLILRTAQALGYQTVHESVRRAVLRGMKAAQQDGAAVEEEGIWHIA